MKTGGGDKEELALKKKDFLTRSEVRRDHRSFLNMTFPLFCQCRRRNHSSENIYMGINGRQCSGETELMYIGKCLSTVLHQSCEKQ